MMILKHKITLYNLVNLVCLYIFVHLTLGEEKVIHI